VRAVRTSIVTMLISTAILALPPTAVTAAVVR
jgi:hypothetical protein